MQRLYILALLVLRKAGQGSLAVFLLAVCLSHNARGQDEVFAAEFGQTTNDFGTINLYTGNFTSVGSYGGTVINDIAYAPSGLVYGIDGGSLVTIDETNAAINTVGNFDASGIESLAFQPTTGTLYAATQGSLYTVNLTTAAATLVGNFGTTTGLNNNGQNIRFAADGNLYDTNTSSNGTSTGLYRIDLGTGNALYLGDVQNYNNLVLANAGNAIYGVSVNVTGSSTTQQTLITFDLNQLDDESSPEDITAIPLDGQANIPPNFNFSGDQDAAVYPVPEPSAYASLFLVFSLGLLVVRRVQCVCRIDAGVRKDEDKTTIDAGIRFGPEGESSYLLLPDGSMRSAQLIEEMRSTRDEG